VVRRLVQAGAAVAGQASRRNAALGCWALGALVLGELAELLDNSRGAFSLLGARGGPGAPF